MPRKAKTTAKARVKKESPKPPPSRPVTPRPGTPNPDGDGEAPAAKRKKELYVIPKQSDLLVEAIDTEAQNRRWLEIRKREALSRESADAIKLEPKHKKHPRRISKPGLTTVTFATVDMMPPFMRGDLEKPKAPNTTCAITGKPAKYRCPRTGLPYFDGAAFKELRRRHGLGDGPLRTNTPDEIAKYGDPRSQLDLPMKGPCVYEDDDPMDWRS